MTINDKISQLRKSMKTHGLDAYIEWISGFTGSAGTVVITHDTADLWTDSRYFLQAETELADTELKLCKPRDRFAPEHIQKLADQLPKGSIVGMDGDLCMIGQSERYQTILKKSNIGLNTDHDLFDEVWSDRPTVPDNPIFEHDLKYAGKSCGAKLNEIRKVMKSQAVDHHLVTTLD